MDDPGEDGAVTLLAVVPVIWEETAAACLDSMLMPHSACGFWPEEILVVDNTRGGDVLAPDGAVGRRLHGCAVAVHRDPNGHNLGVAESWNVAAREVIGRRLDWLVICSTSVIFGPELHTTFRREVEAYPDAQIVESMGNSWHLIAIARSTLETVGLFDPWFYPAYEEAIDWGYRQKVLGLEDVGWPRVWCNAMSIGHAVHVDRSRWDAPAAPNGPLRAYYDEKWGGPKGSERYTRPFGDLSLPVDWWETPFSVAEAARRYGLPEGEWW